MMYLEHWSVVVAVEIVVVYDKGLVLVKEDDVRVLRLGILEVMG